MIFYNLMFSWCLCSILGVYSIDAQTIHLVAEFNSLYVNGSVLFTQTGDGNVEVSIKKLNFPKAAFFSIHEFPVKYNGPMSEICKTEKIGKILSNVSVVKDANLSLSGQDGIFGRSLAIYAQNGKACATIKSNAPTTENVGVFRAVSPGIAGTVVLRQSADNPDSDTAVDINLMLVDARSEPLRGLSLAVYKSASTSNTEGSCEGIGEIFNPLSKTSCDKRKHSTCMIGDLSGKLAQLEIPLPGKGESHKFYIDTNLPLSGKNSVTGRSLVILSNGKPFICTKIQEYQKMAAEVKLDNQGLSGIIGFTQESLYEPVVVNVSLSGEYNRITVYEQALMKDSGAVDDLTMYGPNSIMFRALAINKTASSQEIKQILPKDPTYDLKAQVQFKETTPDGLNGFINFEQVLFNKSKAFAYSFSMVMSVWYKNNQSKITTNHNWHVHISHVGSDSVGKKCMSCLGHYNPYKVYVPDNDYASTCNPSSPFRCELGDSSSKLGTYNIGGGMKQFTETENYFASWHNIIGRSIVIHVKDKGAARLACADIVPLNGSSSYNMETLNVKNTSKTRNKDNFQKVVSKALNIESWRVADAKFEQMKSDKECLTYNFLLIDDSMSDLHQSFADLVEDNPEKLKEFVPACGDEEKGWKIEEGHTSEIIGVVFGIIILIVFIICMILWLRKRRQEHEDSSKLVEGVESAATNETAAENNDNPPSDPKQNCFKVTTSL
ncbi:Superoxide dismutase [Cu-Zn], chloroplastic [Paramuricea clavata]|uniref:Superoxide dismutase [Cu-Zn], chloroplastic n=1 Tax=Paramuricea clavata TaxID=317549 RepID=A0A7D9DI13_PARCT|nr:Superoxide dismutase [Cu-Zn], chloroplastic [Paramuricea clavata]